MNYNCPYCGTYTTITNPNHFGVWNYLDLNRSTHGEIGFRVNAITCPNRDCNELVLTGHLTHSYLHEEKGVIRMWHLLPESQAKILPEYIPMPIQEDYSEACRIRDLSPKASATLARRCLQGMIRDFHGISKQRLSDEIKALEGIVDKDVWESIDAVREVGNIGAHMKKDINSIVDVEPAEAQLLIGLIEQLIDDWYVTRHERRERATKLKHLASSKRKIEGKDEEGQN